MAHEERRLPGARLGVLYIIYNQRIWGQYNPRWRGMASRGSGTDNHKDHVHFTFTWNGALQQSPYWTGKARVVHRGPVRPVPRTLRNVECHSPGDQSAHVTLSGPAADPVGLAVRSVGDLLAAQGTPGCSGCSSSWPNRGTTTEK